MHTGYFTWSLEFKLFHLSFPFGTHKVITISIHIILDEAGEWGTIADNMTGDGVLGAIVERRADIGISALYSW